MRVRDLGDKLDDLFDVAIYMAGIIFFGACSVGMLFLLYMFFCYVFLGVSW